VRPPKLQWTGVCLDCADADQLARFYSQLFGWEITATDGGGWRQLADPNGGVGLNIQADESYEPPVWPEQSGRQAKMLHFEILVDDLEAAVAQTISAGGREATWQPEDRDRDALRIMLDPAGHPFCLFLSGN
jgi:catechol 2,3-dioxygenase-like lactoylglutathione lyase family enzyme